MNSIGKYTSTALTPPLTGPYAGFLDAAGNFLFADSGSNRIRQISPDGTMSTIADDGNSGINATGAPINTSIYQPCAVTLDAAESLYWTEAGNNRIRYLTRPVIFPGDLAGAADVRPATGVQLSLSGGVDVNGVLASLLSDTRVLFDGQPAPLLFAKGEGATTPAGVDGLLATSVSPAPKLPVRVKIDGKPAKIFYAGAVPYLVAGVMQVKTQLPDGLPSGQVPVVLTAGTRIGTATSEISIR